MPWVTRKPSTAFSQLVCQFFLLGRSQFVCVNQATFSKSLEVTCGIPQGSVLATFLFAAHMGSLWCHTVGPHAWPSMLTMFSVSSLWWLGRFCAQRHSTRWLLVQFEWVTAEQVKNKDPHLLQQDQHQLTKCQLEYHTVHAAAGFWSHIHKQPELGYKRIINEELQEDD